MRGQHQGRSTRAQTNKSRKRVSCSFLHDNWQTLNPKSTKTCCAFAAWLRRTCRFSSHRAASVSATQSAFRRICPAHTARFPACQNALHKPRNLKNVSSCLSILLYSTARKHMKTYQRIPKVPYITLSYSTWTTMIYHNSSQFSFSFQIHFRPIHWHCALTVHDSATYLNHQPNTFKSNHFPSDQNQVNNPQCLDFRTTIHLYKMTCHPKPYSQYPQK